MTEQEGYMQEAIEQARLGWGKTNPNPMVGALVVEGGAIVARGAHLLDGGPHAERVALAALGRKPGPGATLYITLEPCSTPGRTGACTEVIIASGINRVVVGATDPNPDHSGRGFAQLRAAGIEVVSGVLSDECTDLNLIFNHWISRKTPLLAGKLAVTLDGKIATRAGESRWITGESARRDVHRWRQLFPAVAVGSNTLAKDNPRLTSRLGADIYSPLRMVFVGARGLAGDQPERHLYTDEYKARTIIVTGQGQTNAGVDRLERGGTNVWRLPQVDGRVGWKAFRARCQEERITGIYFEGGAGIFSSLMRQRELDYLFLYRAPLICGDEAGIDGLVGAPGISLANSIRLQDLRRDTFGDDDLIRGKLTYPG